MTLNTEWLKTALSITGDFETSGNPFAGITGNFDAMGISCGVLQWNIGMGSLQLLVKKAGLETVKRFMPRFGQQLWDACQTTIPAGLAIVNSWQNGSRIKPEVRAELVKLFSSDEMVQVQMQFALKVGNISLELATKWAKDARNSNEPTLHEFCWFFDLVVLNGGMRQVWLEDVKTFIEGHQPEKVDDVICDWLENLPPTDLGRSDSRRNAQLWRDKVKPKHLELFVLGYLRALKSRTEFQGVVVNRRSTIATTKGYVNGELEDLNILH